LVLVAFTDSVFAGAGSGAGGGGGAGLAAAADGAGAGFSSTELQAIASTIISVTLSGQEIVVTELFIRDPPPNQLFRKLDSFRQKIIYQLKS
jgi:hypothetical protein